MHEIRDSDEYKTLNDKDQFDEHFQGNVDVEKNVLKKDNTSYGSLNNPDDIVEDEVSKVIVIESDIAKLFKLSDPRIW